MDRIGATGEGTEIKEIRPENQGAIDTTATQAYRLAIVSATQTGLSLPSRSTVTA